VAADSTRHSQCTFSIHADGFVLQGLRKLVSSLRECVAQEPFIADDAAPDDEIHAADRLVLSDCCVARCAAGPGRMPSCASVISGGASHIQPRSAAFHWHRRNRTITMPNPRLDSLLSDVQITTKVLQTPTELGCAASHFAPILFSLRQY
jgi:hypothetical protein